MEKIIQTAIVGFGLSGRVFHAPFIHVHPGFRLKKVVERFSENARAIYPDAQIVRNHLDLLKDPDLDLVVITTPNIYHFDLAREFLEGGKHVVVEKPFTTSSAEADELIRIGEKSGRKIFVYHNRRWDGDFKTVQQVVYNGHLGQLLNYEAHFDRFAPGPRRSAWRDQPLPGGGVLFDLGSHLIDQALVLFGMPQAVFADIRSQRDKSRIDDYFEVWLMYEELKAILKAGVFVREPGPKYILHGRKGSFVKYGADPQEELLKQGFLPGGEEWGADDPDDWGWLHTEINTQVFHGSIETERGNYMEFYDNVYGVIARGHAQAVTPDEARNVIRIIELAFESKKLGSLVRIQ